MSEFMKYGARAWIRKPVALRWKEELPKVIAIFKKSHYERPFPMNKPISRRRLLAGAMAGAATACLPRTANAIDYNELPEDARKLTAYQVGRQVWVRWQNRIVTVYRAHPTQKYPYFYPLNGPVTGISLTEDSRLPYPHHRSLFLGCQPLNGGDYWGGGNLDAGQIVSKGLKIDQAEATSADFSDACDWIRRDHPSPLKDQRRFTVRILNDQVHLLDCRFTLTAQEDITIKRAKHSFFAIKTANDIAPMGGGRLTNSEGGEGAKGTYGKPARWCSYFGRRHGNPEVVEGITIMNHPENFGGNCPWFTRDYGHLSPSPFNFLDKPWTLAQGETLDLRYRVVLHAGAPADAGLDAVYQDWVRAS